MKKHICSLTAALFVLVSLCTGQSTLPRFPASPMPYNYYSFQYLGSDSGLIVPRRVGNFTPSRQMMIYDTASGKMSFYLGSWKSLQDVTYSGDYNDLINRPDLSMYVPVTRTINGYNLGSNITLLKSDVGLSNVQNVDVTNATNISSGTLADARLSGNVTLQGNSFNGAGQLLLLDGSGKVSYSNLPAALMIYKGIWNPTTNTPTLADGTGTNGWVYRVSPGGTINLGSGSITFNDGDYVIYNGTIWQKSGNADAVTSVNGYTGVIVLSTADIAEGGTRYYYTDARVQSFSDTRYSLLGHTHTTSDITNLSSYTGFDIRYKSISYTPAWTDITGKPVFAAVATSGAYSDLIGLPSLGSLAALSSIGNSYITDLAWSKITGAPSFLTSESDPVYTASSWYGTTNNSSNWNTAYGWGNWAAGSHYVGTTLIANNRASGSQTLTGVSIDGNSATTTLAANSTLWNSQIYNNAVTISPTAIMVYTGANNWYQATAATVQSFLGLGSAAYTASSAYVPTSGYSFGSSFTMGTMNGTGLTGGSSLSAAVGYDGNGYIYKYTAANVQTFLGLGTNAYTSTAYLPLTAGSGRPLSGTLYVPNVQINGYDLSYQLYVGGGIRVDGNSTFGGYSLTAGTITGSNGYFPNGLTINNTNSATYATLQMANDLGKDQQFFVFGSARPDTYFGQAAANWAVNYTTTANGMMIGTYNSTSLILGTNNAAAIKIDNTQNTSLYGALTLPDASSLFIQNSSSSRIATWNISSNLYLGDIDNKFYNVIIRQHGVDAININGSQYTTFAGGGSFSGPLTASSIIKSGGASTQFLKADGSIDANTYLTSAVTSLTGTANQVSVSASTGAVTVSLPSSVTISGNMNAAAFYETSDRRLKTEIPDYQTFIYQPIEGLKSRLYKKGDETQYGYYAQDAMSYLPLAVQKGSDGYYRLDYIQVFVVKIAALEKRVASLEAKLNEREGVR